MENRETAEKSNKWKCQVLEKINKSINPLERLITKKSSPLSKNGKLKEVSMLTLLIRVKYFLMYS